ncbi:MAG: pyrimidine 5'-nucleotidase [Pelolinea sp.]|nr:pyrimidine 5'-nucleotidase [Pelolinea sp.]
MFHTLFIDLDNTLYPKSSGLMDAIRDRIITYMHERLGLEESEILALRQYSLQKYGTTLLGLKERFEINEFEYLDYVHNVNLADHLKNDIRLKALLESYTQRKIIFTNADRNHVDRILKFLDISHLIDKVIDIHTLMPHLKPHKEAFNKALEIAELPTWDGCAFMDDHPANIEQARKMGIYSILIDERSQYQDNLKISSIYDLPSLIPFES